jgi:ParB/RepB/Spo0J family partition protein
MQATRQRRCDVLPVTKLLPLQLLDIPDVAMRVQIDDDYIRELAGSIAEQGLLTPIAVRAENGRFKIYAGHCRYLAIKSLRWSEVECRDYTGVDIPPEAIKAHENLYRRDPNDGELVVWLGDLQEKYNYPLEKLQAITGKSENWLSERLSLYRGDREVFDALLAGKIKLGHAVELNRFPDGYRRTYLLQVVESTPPIRLVQQWRRDLELMNLPAPAPNGGPVLVAPEALPGVAPVEPCRFCKEAHSPWTMEFIKVHKGCLHTILQALEAGGQ